MTEKELFDPFVFEEDNGSQPDSQESLFDFKREEPPEMPVLGEGMEPVELLLSQVTEDMRQSIAPALFPLLATHMRGVSFMYPSNVYMEPHGMMVHLIAESGEGKGQFTVLQKAVTHSLREQDDKSLKKYLEWQKEATSKGSNSQKPEPPKRALWCPQPNITNAAFMQNAMECEENGNHAQYFYMPEVELANRICEGHNNVTLVFRQIFDCDRAGAVRYSKDGFSGEATLRVNINISSTPIEARRFYRDCMLNGTFGRMAFSYKPFGGFKVEIPKQGGYDESFIGQVDLLTSKLHHAEGKYIPTMLNRRIEDLNERLTHNFESTDDRVMKEFANRSLIMAWKAGCILYILNGQVYTEPIGNFVEWLVVHDLWSKQQVFGKQIKTAQEDPFSSSPSGSRGPKNMLDMLPEEFTLADLEKLRVSVGMSKEGARDQAYKWKDRGHVSYDKEKEIYRKR